MDPNNVIRLDPMAHPRSLLERLRRAHAAARRTDGLTVVELLIITALMVTIAAIAMPMWTQLIARAKIDRAILDIDMLEADIGIFISSKDRLPMDLDELGSVIEFDPWGREYHYLPFIGKGWKSERRQDKWLNPLNSDYDLFSAGPDGDWHKQLDHKLSIDDVVRANDGAYVGVAKYFSAPKPKKP